MNYRVNYDRSYTYISGTDEEEENGYDVFESFSVAKKHAIEDIREEIDGLQTALKRVRQQKKSEIEIE